MNDLYELILVTSSNSQKLLVNVHVPLKVLYIEQTSVLNARHC